MNKKHSLWVLQNPRHSHKLDTKMGTQQLPQANKHQFYRKSYKRIWTYLMHAIYKIISQFPLKKIDQSFVMPDKVFPIKLVDRTGEQIEVGILY